MPVLAVQRKAWLEPRLIAGGVVKKLQKGCRNNSATQSAGITYDGTVEYDPPIRT